jgi:S1-C subfamily serine protease
MTLLLCLACATLAWDEPPKAASAPAPAAIDVVSALEEALGDAIAGAEGSVVAIHRDKTDDAQETLAVRGRTPPTRPFAPGMPRAVPVTNLGDMISFDFGSGVVVGDEGQILTAFHVVKGATRLIVKATDRQVFSAEVIAADPRSDLAVIAPVREPGLAPPRLKPIAIRDAGKLRKGSFLVVLGNPFIAARDGKASASWGILSNIARRIELDMDDFQFPRQASPQLLNYPTLLQLDAKLNLGMSGGAVVNMKGELVGLTTMASSPAGFDAMAGYAIPMDRTGRRAVETLKHGKEVEYGLLGVTSHQNNTNIVEEVTLNSPAALGDLQQGDEIVGVDGQPVVDFDSLILAVNAYAAGDAIRLQIRRGGREIEKTIVLGKFPVKGEIIVTNPRPAWRGLRVDYLTMLPRGNIGLLEDAPAPGVIVRDVEPDSPAAQSGFKDGQIVHRVDGKPVANPDQFAKVVAKLSGPVTLLTDQGAVVVP